MKLALAALTLLAASPAAAQEPVVVPGQTPHAATRAGDYPYQLFVPPGYDPAQVDVRTFYPSVLPIHEASPAVSDAWRRYQPNEVKHRKRTTRPQLKVLEDVYRYDKKPNAGLRKKLADELGMTPRGVQVRRRAQFNGGAAERNSKV